jgi:hypothetical protein
MATNTELAAILRDGRSLKASGLLRMTVVRLRRDNGARSGF